MLGKNYFVKILLFLLLMVSLSAAQLFQYLNVSESGTSSKKGAVVIDRKDNLHVFWIEDNHEIRYRSRLNQSWSNVLTVYQSDSATGLTTHTANVLNDSVFVFFGDQKGDSSYLICCKFLDGALQKSDTLKRYSGAIENLRSATQTAQISIAFRTTPSTGITDYYVFQYPSQTEWLLPNAESYASSDFVLASDKGDTLWFFSVNTSDYVYACYLQTDALQWSDWSTIIAAEFPLIKIDCKYNDFSKRFNMILLSDFASCMDCIENNIIYTEGYAANWTDCDYLERSGYVYMGQGSYNDPHIEITSAGTRKLFYKFDYSNEISGDEYSIRRAQRTANDTSWNINPVLLFSGPDFRLCDTGMDSKDSTRLIYTYQNDVYLASKDNPSLINPGKVRTSASFRLFPAYPNPFNASTHIRYRIPVQANISITVFDCSGKGLLTLFQGHRKSGLYSLTWQANDFPSGVYFISLKTDHGFTDCRKIVLLK